MKLPKTSAKNITWYVLLEWPGRSHGNFERRAILVGCWDLNSLTNAHNYNSSPCRRFLRKISYHSQMALRDIVGNCIGNELAGGGKEPTISNKLQGIDILIAAVNLNLFTMITGKFNHVVTRRAWGILQNYVGYLEERLTSASKSYDHTSHNCDAYSPLSFWQACRKIFILANEFKRSCGFTSCVSALLL